MAGDSAVGGCATEEAVAVDELSGAGAGVSAGVGAGLPELPMLVLQGRLMRLEPAMVSRQHRLRWLIPVGWWLVRG